MPVSSQAREYSSIIAKSTPAGCAGVSGGQRWPRPNVSSGRHAHSPPAAPAAPPVPPRPRPSVRTHACSLACSLAISLACSLAACSSASDLGTSDGATSTSASDTAVTNPASGGEPTSSGQGDGGSDPGNGGESSSGGGSDSSERPSDVPPAEPTPADLVDSKGLGESDGCDLQAPVHATLRTVDAAATVSPTQARDAALSGWVSLTGIRIRPWEFFNYYSFDYPVAEPGALAITPQMAAVPGLTADPEFLLQLGVATQALAAGQRPPVRLTLALDNSNSMAGKAQDMQRAAGKALANHLRQGDILSIVTWNAKSPTVLELHAVTGPGDPVILEKLDALELGGGAELYSGLTSAYKLAVAGYDPTAWNRVLIISDGGATANDTDLDVIRAHADKQIYLSGVGVGEAGIYRSDMIDAAAHAGRGASLFIGSEAEADRRFGDQFVRTLGAAVRDLEVHLDLPPSYQLLRDPSQDPLDDFSGDALSVRLGPNDSLVLHRRLRSCDPDAASDPDAQLLVRVTFIDELSGEAREAKSAVGIGGLLADKPAALYKGAAIAAYAAALQRWQARPADLAPALAEAAARLQDALALLSGDPELAELAAVLAVLGDG